jgi:ribosomal protein S12 methylthiotransferase accessory factor
MAEDAYSDRICPASETWTRIAPLLETHGVTRLARVTGLDRIGIPVWNAIRPNSRSLSLHQGKGITDEDARVSAAMEALERAVAGDLPLAPRTACRAELLREGAMVDSLNELVARGHDVIDDAAAIHWVAGEDLVRQSPVWVPADAVGLDRTRTDGRFWQSSDGLASGNTTGEAVLHGLLERIERDAETLWGFAGARARAEAGRDAASIRDPVIAMLRERIEQAGLTLHLFDITSNIGIPCVQALIAPERASGRTQLRFRDVANGSGAHPSFVRAAIRAITEAVQARLTLIGGARDDVPAETYDRPLPRSLRDDLATVAQPVPADLPDAFAMAPGTLDDIVARLKRRSIDRVVAVPLTPPGHPFSVVKVLVPQLENPDGARRQRYGRRALARMAVFS